MRTASMGFVVGLLGALGLAAMPDGDDLKIGVLNLKECFKGDRYKWVKEIDTELRELVDRQTKALADLDKKILRLREKIVGLPAGSKLAARVREELTVARAQLDARKKSSQAEYLRVYTRRKTAVFQEILRVAAEVGKAKGLDLILRGEDPSFEVDAKGASDITRLMYRRSVMYSSPRIDITDEVVKKLNAEYGKGGK